MSDISSALASPESTNSTLPSSVPSPDIKTLKIDGYVVTEQAKAEAAELKARANKAFTSLCFVSTVDLFNLYLGHDFTTAIQLYSDSIEKNPNDPTVWCNRAYARMKLEEFGYALNDASEICSPSFIPAFVESASYRSSDPVGSQVRESALSVRFFFLLIRVLYRRNRRSADAQRATSRSSNPKPPSLISKKSSAWSLAMRLSSPSWYRPKS